MYGVSIGMEHPFGQLEDMLNGAVNCAAQIHSAMVSFLNFEKEKTWLLIDNPPSANQFNGVEANLPNIDSKEVIMAKLADIRCLVRSGDSVDVFFAGYCSKDDGSSSLFTGYDMDGEEKYIEGIIYFYVFHFMGCNLS